MPSYEEIKRWEQIHDDLALGVVSGVYGGDNAAYHGLAGLRAGVDMKNWHSKRSLDEFYLPSLEFLLKQEYTRRSWDRICTLDPLGMYASPPTMSATEAVIMFPEISDKLVCDGKIVDPIDRSIKVTKIAVDYVWNIPLLSQRINQSEDDVRQALYDYTQNPTVLDKKNTAYLPPVGGCTIYIIGDPRKLADPKTEVCVRVHDACAGSDVMGTDICTCRPYIAFAAQACAETAQRGGVGVIVYYRKEGRSLGEVTKFRVYNARKRQEGGDRAEKYFYQTESIAGIRDARFQELMPDPLNFLGITRIDWLCSMSNEKYDAIVGAGIKVMQRVSLPDYYVPKNAQVEITAKIASGYHTDKMDSKGVIADLRTLPAIRRQCKRIFELSKEGNSKHFNVNLDKLSECADYVLKVTKDAYPTLDIPYHARWRHFHEGDLNNMINKWPCDKLEEVRRLIDLVTISVLLDAGAGDKWRYRTIRDESIGRSEGLGLASFDMFQDGIFSSDASCVPCRVNANGLEQMTYANFCKGFQHREDTNPLVGIKGRFELLKALAKALKQNPEFFGQEVCRPGNVVDYVIKYLNPDKEVSINVLWKAIIEGLESIWPKNDAGVRRGDVWTYSPLRLLGSPGSDLVPFHKLSQWLTYSLLEPFEKLGVKFTDLDLMTGLAEYRNGGLFVDTGVLTLKDADSASLKYATGSELVVEWRALTICLLDETYNYVLEKLNKTSEEFPLAKLLQGGTWTAGRKLAAKYRPDTNAPPISIQSNGNVF